MKKNLYSLVGCAALMAGITSCYPEQEIAPIVPPTENAIATITPQGEYTNVQEGDTLYFDVTVDKMVRQAITFAPVFNDNSEADASDIEMLQSTLPAYATSTTLAVIVLSDGIAETAETFSFNLDASGDIGYNFQLNPNSDSEVVNFTANNWDITLDYSEGTHAGSDMCEWHVDLDLILFNADESVISYDGASADCPLETANLTGLPDDTYYIYVDNYANDIPEGSGVLIPWKVKISNNSGEVYELAGEFNSDNAGGEAVIVGSIEIANGVYTVKDADDNVLGTI